MCFAVLITSFLCQLLFADEAVLRLQLRGRGSAEDGGPKDGHAAAGKPSKQSSRDQPAPIVQLPDDSKFDAHFRWPKGAGPPDPELAKAMLAMETEQLLKTDSATGALNTTPTSSTSISAISSASGGAPPGTPHKDSSLGVLYELVC